MESRLAQLHEAEREKARKAEEAENASRQQERHAEEKRQVVLRKQQDDYDARQKALEQQRERQRLEAERLRLQKERKDREEQEEREREARERAKQNAVEAQHRRQEEIRKEAERKADLEKRGLSYYPKATTLYKEKNAEQWYQYAVANPQDANIQQQAAEALVALKEEGMPFLITFLERAVIPPGVHLVLNLIAPEYVHVNDLPKIVACLDKKRSSAQTRMLALGYLRKRKESKAHIERIETLVTDLKASPKYQAEVKEALKAIKSAE